jgi:enamine deaminase RidA (YjgF/YER057c/UK114 family)
MRIFNPEDLPAPKGFNQGVLLRAAGGVLFVAGQIGVDREGRLVGDGFVEQFERAVESVVRVVQDAGGSPESIGRLTIFVTDKREYEARRHEIGEAYRRHMGRHFPAMTLVEVSSLLVPGTKVEIEATAVL